MPAYTQILARTARPTQALAALKDLDVYMFPHSSVGTLICERTSEALDLRIMIQVAGGISWRLGRGCAVLAIACDETTGFWCALFEGGDVRFEHNRLTGARSIADQPATLAKVEVLCGSFDAGVSPRAVHEILTRGDYESAVARHAAFAEALGLPSWLPGIGYSRIVDGSLPREAGAPRKPSFSVEKLWPLADQYKDLISPDFLATFQGICGRAFEFLETEFGFSKELSQNVDLHPKIRTSARTLGGLQKDYQNAFILCYRRPWLTVVVEGLSFGALTRLCLIDQEARYLDLEGLVERRNPKLLDLCALANIQREQIPRFAATLRMSASDVLAGDLRAISPKSERRPGFSFAFLSPSDADRILVLYGPQSHPETISARHRMAARRREAEAIRTAFLDKMKGPVVR
jgi:hypothetical protein